MTSQYLAIGGASRMLILSCALFVPGCSGGDRVPVVPVSGQMFVKSQPAEGALVVLRPLGDDNPEHWKQGFPRATVAADGSFRVGTYGADDGAPAGEYVVLATWYRVAQGANPDDPEAEKTDQLGGQFADPAQSPLRATVKEPKTELPRLDL